MLLKGILPSMVSLSFFLHANPFEDEAALGSDGVRQTTGRDG